MAAHLLQAGASERPEDASVDRALRALGVSGAILSTSAAASGAKVSTAATAGGGAGAGVAGGAAAAASSTAKAVSATFLVKWIGIGVVGGVGLAGAAVVAAGPATPKPAAVVAASLPEPRVVVAPAPVVQPARPSDVVDVPAPVAPPLAVASTPRVSASVPEPAAAPPAHEESAPLAAEVASVDHARSQLAAGQAAQTLATLQNYEQQFPAARLLPEVLFLRLEAGERLGRTAEARTAAQRLVDGFPQSPHASSARKLLGP